MATLAGAGRVLRGKRRIARTRCARRQDWTHWRQWEWVREDKFAEGLKRVRGNCPSGPACWLCRVCGMQSNSNYGIKEEFVMTGVFFSSRRRHTRLQGDWSSDVCSSD